MQVLRYLFSIIALATILVAMWITPTKEDRRDCILVAITFAILAGAF